ncbi:MULTISPECIES: A/G-specific adenine glycosylase [unclassified Brevibacterium]|uniref:A/G-specific adenine glycosylase n=1 Tax=unclassified Brevibacterium TaxID=2614124 RepID=UPI001091B4D6|nr:A/G-specific adenine glycosylase [Brevibacterium sp. S22]TGD30637.1 A/G-specific adenine glycosylase [Brevibacterium sp. S22]
MTHRVGPESKSSASSTDFPAVTESLLRRVQDTIIAWFEEAARDLPWRHPNTSAWAILVSEIMSQQTPVARVEPRWRAWMDEWPTPADLAAAPTAEVLHAWGRLGYPRRALRLQEAAAVIADELDNQVPETTAELERLPGIGSYTAAAVSSFAFGRKTTVLDTNVRRVLIRLFAGRERPAASPGRQETAWASDLVPEHRHVEWNAGVMEFGALVCTARNPDCPACPLQDICTWNQMGRPASATKRKTQKWAGTDRQLRGAIMDVLKAAHAAGDDHNGVSTDVFTTTVTDFDPALVDSMAESTSAAVARVRELSADQDRISRLITDLVADGLAQQVDGRLALPNR